MIDIKWTEGEAWGWGQAPEIVVSCLDPLGRAIVAHRERWARHIEARHPELATPPGAVQSTIKTPEQISADANNPNGANFYRFAALPPPHHWLSLNVCVTFDSGTAWPV